MAGLQVLDVAPFATTLRSKLSCLGGEAEKCKMEVHVATISFLLHPLERS